MVSHNVQLKARGFIAVELEVGAGWLRDFAGRLKWTREGPAHLLPILKQGDQSRTRRRA